MTASLSASPVGRTTRIQGYDPRFREDYDVEAFLPDDLPERLDLHDSTWLILTEAMTELGRIDAAARLIPNPTLVTRMATRREAIGTSALEGTFAALPELLAADVLPADARGDVPPNAREVRNYVVAADAAYAWIRERSITVGMLSALQAEIVKGTDADGMEAGSIRRRQVFIGAKNRRLSDARFIPPPPGDQLRAGVERWVEWLTAITPSSHIPILARIAMAHYQFETLHPFTDGNGRLGRLVAVVQMLREGISGQPARDDGWAQDRLRQDSPSDGNTPREHRSRRATAKSAQFGDQSWDVLASSCDEIEVRRRRWDLARAKPLVDIHIRRLVVEPAGSDEAVACQMVAPFNERLPGPGRGLRCPSVDGVELGVAQIVHGSMMAAQPWQLSPASPS